ncbi:conserved hypothetical protein [Ricinus communis]|uniref:Uncharacterized protein n=1 Tax=Ricinus communis TaxID=3988 RepID=B9RMW0_RICCO|nr:conserved hypothetical protein [Ricinus communis]
MKFNSLYIDSVGLYKKKKKKQLKRLVVAAAAAAVGCMVVVVVVVLMQQLLVPVARFSVMGAKGSPPTPLQKSVDMKRNYMGNLATIPVSFQLPG